MYRQRQIRSIRARKGLLRTSKLDAQGILDYLAQEQPPLEHLPSIRKLVKLFREDRRIWVTRDVCNEALNLAKAGNKGTVPAQQPPEPALVLPEPVIAELVIPEPA